MRAFGLMILAGGILAVALWLRPSPAPVPVEATRAPLGEWAGSAACQECHPDLYAKWQKTAHARTIRDFGKDTVAKPFRGELFDERGVESRLGPGTEMECEGPGGTTQTFPVEWVIGVRRVQMFTTPMKHGRIQVLPVFLEVPERRWFPYLDFIFGMPRDFKVEPDSAYSWYGPHRNYNSRCGRCHMTDYEIGYDADTGVYDTRWHERVVACESCHGPAGGHVNKWRGLQEGPDPIVNPVRLPVDSANQICGSCHAESVMVQTGFRPGDDLFAFFDVAGLDDPKHLFPDGRARELIHNYLPILESRCGPLACTKCHDPHGGRGIPGDLYRPLSDDWTCTQCHGEIGADVEAHTHHPAPSEGSRCVRCHMPRLVIEGGHGKTFDHTISIPSIRNTQDLGLPNACRSCHNEEFPGWEYEPFAKWYPEADQRNHRVPLAAAIDAARRGQKTDGLAALLRDKNPVYRAAAAYYLGGQGADLRPQLADEHPMVRRAAIWGVAKTHPEALVPLLESPNHVLRREAALRLASRDGYRWIAAHPAWKARCATVLEEAAVQRPDAADLHFALSRIQADPKKAARSLRRYKILRPYR